MKVKLRRGNQNDLDQVYDLHTKCFSSTDCWYKSSIRPYLEKAIVLELSDTKQIIGVLLQGYLVPCNKKFDVDENQNSIDNYKADIFEPVNKNGELFMEKEIHYRQIYGIMMICVDKNFRGKGLAKKLITKHFADNINKVVCLNTRHSNISAYKLYQTMGYEHIAYIKNKYFLPSEDSIFMIKDLSNSESI
jgi:ribosomal protein S18 acetylase RimI-like enzyme